MIRRFTYYFLVCLLFIGVVIPVFSYDMAIDKELKAIWNGLREALASRDIDKAVSYFAYETRQYYRELFTALADHLPELVQDWAILNV